MDTAQLAGIGADCLHVPVGGGEETYCVTGDGLLALLDTATMRIELTSFAPDADPAAFTRPGQASTTTSWSATRFIASGPSAVATTMSSRRSPNSPAM